MAPSAGSKLAVICLVALEEFNSPSLTERTVSLGPASLWPPSLLFVTMYGHILRAGTKHFLLPWRHPTSPLARVPQLRQLTQLALGKQALLHC